MKRMKVIRFTPSATIDIMRPALAIPVLLPDMVARLIPEFPRTIPTIAHGMVSRNRIAYIAKRSAVAPSESETILCASILPFETAG